LTGVAISDGTRRTVQGAQSDPGGTDSLPLDHYFRLLWHRKWWVLAVWVVVSATTYVIVRRLPDVYMSETVILVDPQKVPEAYVKSTITGDIRNRLGTLSQQILSSSRLQKIIDSHNLYQAERAKGAAREDVITKMRSDISVRVVSEFGSAQDLQAFRITYSGKDARLVSLVAQQLASLFIEENLSARELQATGTYDFLTNQLQETRKQLEQQEAKLKDFQLRHVGEMPAQEAADLQLLSQAQSQLQQEADALARAEQQRTYLQSMLTQTVSVVDIDEVETNTAKRAEASSAPNELAKEKARLATLLSHYTESHPDVRKLKGMIEEEEARQAQAAMEAAASAPPDPAPAAAPVKRTPHPPSAHFNPVLESQLKALDAEIAKHNEEQQRLSKLVSLYRAKLEAIPVRQQEITALQRDYEISKNHYKQLLDNQLAAQTSTQLEFRQKGEKFEVLDPATPAERPSRPNRSLYNMVGSMAGLVLGLVLAMGKEFLVMSVITSQDAVTASGLPLLGEIPVIRTQFDRRRRNRWILATTTSGLILALACGGILFYYYRIQT